MALGKLVVELIDIQSILALALVIGAYSKSSPTSAYHLRLVQYLVTLNTLAVLCALGFTVRFVHLPLTRLLSLVALLVAWVVPVAKGTWSDADKIVREAQCFRTSGSNNDSFSISGLGIDGDGTVQFGVVLCVFYVMSIVLLWGCFWRRKRNRQQRSEQSGTVDHRSFETTRRVAKALCLYFPLSLGIVSLIYVGKTIKAIVELRKAFEPYLGEKENEWGYGQVLTMALLIPLFSEYIAGTFRKFFTSMSLLTLILRQKVSDNRF